ncbi:hypothetical protein KNV77_gp047 [Klebsiella phage vB_KpnP_P184]|uniref:Uncharacterized protein n=1 Tax=Klebsiella phage vB_KpnP_P184 TaxID=2806547 RepID=A0A898KAD7_9CAUD|nr:hypothetical protein KNV77_gp047 [Klebsiella phage vB_KpnP_P184]QSJ03653.1 hypothetical protein [Klebsiella phage vB_KpnP_P184]
MKPVVKDVMHDLRKLLPVAEQALSTQTMKLDERVAAISQWRELTSPAMITALLDRIDQLEKLWVEPTKDMVNAGLGEVQRMLDEWESDHLGWCVDDVSDDQASDMAVFTLQAMASKLPKEPD